MCAQFENHLGHMGEGLCSRYASVHCLAVCHVIFKQNPSHIYTLNNKLIPTDEISIARTLKPQLLLGFSALVFDVVEHHREVQENTVVFLHTGHTNGYILGSRGLKFNPLIACIEL